MRPNVLELCEVTKRFGPLTAVDGASLTVAKGSIVALLGPSGCGKTTLLRMIAGFEQPDEGEIILEGRNVAGKRPYERNVGLLFQDYALFPHMTVENNVAYGLHQRGVEASQIKRRTDEMLALVGMRDFAQRYPQNLSGGQQQRVALGRALANSPPLVLLDEPLSALDAKLRLELRAELRRILKLSEATAVVVTHDQQEAMTLGERVIVMEGGRIRQDGLPVDLYDRPQTRFIAEFIGRSNWFNGTLGPSSGNFRELFYGAAKPLMIRDPGTAKGTSYDVCIRPEHIRLQDRLAATPEAEKGYRNRVDGVVKDVVYLGSNIETLVTIESGKEVCVVEQNSRQPSRTIGQNVTLLFSPEDLIVIERRANP
jgi:ABC-type Fe3+/spermidine/putrescine transport system ATPase subunit